MIRRLSAFLWRWTLPKQTRETRELAAQIRAAQRSHKPTRHLRKQMAERLAGRS